jgi:hypothetical protein
MRDALFLLSAFVLLCLQSVRAQISPGELSSAHQQLEGITNCAQCHESGKEISGAKCLSCHKEIKAQIEARHGFHYASAGSTCISCHKEHLGRSAMITRFDSNQFDHSKTGFLLKGKHGQVKCEECHSAKYIKSQDVIKTLGEHPRQTFLGLDRQCVACHTDRHQGSVSTNCESCHTVNAWTPATNFDHNKAKYTLVGKHKPVICAKCHEPGIKKGPTDPILFRTKSFADCTPCHASPHGSRFTDRTCRSCHTPEGWSTVKSFNHSETRFPLVGKHVAVKCQNCHTHMEAGKVGSVNLATKDFRDCTPCHTSPHSPMLSTVQCKSCHEATAWSTRSPRPFDHSLTRFKLEGRHNSLKCEECHKPSPKATFAQRYMLQYLHCTNCHADYHQGQFSEKYSNDCARCHSENGFRPSTFSAAKHADTKLPLLGAHAAVPCIACHPQRNESGTLSVQYKGVPFLCQGCHKDVHAGQFDRNGETPCGLCHTANGWRALLFNHDAQSSFRLTGAHSGVPCRACHKVERIGGQIIVRFKPLSSTCESCHEGGK